MSYTVIFGIDPIADRRQTASECLERVLILEAQAEPGIRILDPAGAEIRLGQLEALQKNEVERKYLAQALKPFDTELKRPSSVAGGRATRKTVAATLAALAMLVAVIGTVSQFRARNDGAQPAKNYGAQHANLAGAPGKKAAPRPKEKATEGAGELPAGRPPGKEGPARDEATQTRRYKIEAGDTLTGIAEKLYRNPDRWRDIAAVNPHLDPRRLHPGKIINLPQDR